MKTEYIIIIAGFIGLAVLIYIEITKPLVFPPPRCKTNTVENCTRDTWIMKPPYMINNNMWGASQDMVGLMSCIYSCEGENVFGYKWNRTAEERARGTGPIYPEIIVGRQPWDWIHQPSWNKFPIKIADITSFIVDIGYIYLVKPSSLFDFKNFGMFNFGLETWVADQSTPTDNISHLKNEIMVWYHQTPYVDGPGDYAGTISDAYNTYKRYRRDSGSNDTPYDAFLIQDGNRYGQTYYTVDFKKILDYMVQNGVVNNQHYLHGLELGHEVGWGHGMIEINKFQIDLNGDHLI